jgi:Flp pilus assembly protein TadG
MKWFKKEKGQSFVEFALVLPVLLIIIMAILEFGLMFNAYITISNASREGARLGSLGGSDIEIVQRVVQTSPVLDSTKITVTVTPATRTRGDMLRVLVSYDYTLITPVISNIISPMVDLDAETVMRVE